MLNQTTPIRPDNLSEVSIDDEVEESEFAQYIHTPIEEDIISVDEIEYLDSIGTVQTKDGNFIFVHYGSGL